MAARRTAILTGAREMLAEKNVADISLRELSGRIGLAKSNVLRYFDSREAIFLEILDEEFGAWLADLEARLGFLLGAFSKRIEAEIEQNLDALLAASAKAPARKAAKKGKA